MRRDVFQAIADPTRRQIISMVARDSLNLNAVARQFNVSRPAISKHIKILAECGLITINQQGRERFCEAKVEKLTEVSDWLVQFREMWEGKFDSLDNYLTEIQEKAEESIPEEKEAVTEVVVASTEEEELATPEMPKFLAPRQKKLAATTEEKVSKPKKTKTKAKKKKTKKVKPQLLVGKVTPVEPEKKIVKKAPEPEESLPEPAPNQYSLF